MSETEQALPGTTYLAPARRTAFYEHYQKQYSQTLAWLQIALQQAAHQRDQQRPSDRANQTALREKLAQSSGFAQAWAGVSQVTKSPTPSGATTYCIQNELGLLYTGLLWEPAPATPLRGAVILAGETEPVTQALIAAYRAQGLRVIVPCLAHTQHSFQDHPTRHWYHFGDDELLQLFFFIVGGSLAGLEAAELLTIAQALTVQEGVHTPVVLHSAGRHLLSAAVAAALAPGLAGATSQPIRALVLPETVARLDHQESDERINLIWNFHNDFDGLTLFDLAGADLLFVEATPTPSASLSRALAWFGQPSTMPQPRVTSLVAPALSTLAARVSLLLGVEPSPAPPATLPTIDLALAHAAQLYQEALASKVAFLEGLHEQARQNRQARYDLSQLTPTAYRNRVAESLARVAGPPLPESAAHNPHTRLIARHPAYALYEVVLESVPGVEVAGYLLLPTTPTAAPAVICQHGLGGRPEALVGIGDRLEGHQWVYDRFAQRLAERGYVVFVPFMNWGWASTALRDQLVKHAYALGFAPNRFEVAQLHAIVDFLQTQPSVLADRIAFYGLSYGGHASLWLCAHEPRLAAVVTAGHFNEWQTKLLNPEISPPLVRPTAYVTVDEGYDMFNYNVLNELDHAELATRFVPRPQMIENGLQDTVTPTAWVNREFARTQAVFTWLDAAGDLELEHFPGPHRVWAEGSFRFLERHLRRG